MNKKNRKSLAFVILLILSSIAGIVLVFAVDSKYGPGITHDSAAYIYAAKSVLKGEGYQYFGYPSPFIQWPPLLPTLLALAGIIGIKSVMASICINAIAHGLIILIAGYWFFNKFNSRLFALTGTLMLVFSVPLLQVSKYLWTETLFILFFLLFYVKFEAYFFDKNRKSLAAAGVFAALACLDRHAGVTIVLAGVIFLLFQKKYFLKRITDIIFFGIISVFPISIWVIRNYVVSSTLLGVRIPSTFTLKQNLKRTMDSVYTWIKPDSMLSDVVSPRILSLFMTYTIFIVALISFIFIALSVYDLIRKKPASGSDIVNREIRNGDVKNGCDTRLFSIIFSIIFSAIYITYLIISASSVALEPINSRYLVPIYLPAVVMIFTAADILSKRLEQSINRYLTGVAAAILFCLFLIYPALNTGYTLMDNIKNGAGGLSVTAWQSNKLISYVKNNPDNCTYYSNSADAVTALTGVRTYFLPKKSGSDMYGLKQFRLSIEKDGCSYIIWFKKGDTPAVYGIEDIRKLYRLEFIEQNSDGTVYRLVK